MPALPAPRSGGRTRVQPQLNGSADYRPAACASARSHVTQRPRPGGDPRRDAQACRVRLDAAQPASERVVLVGAPARAPDDTTNRPLATSRTAPPFEIEQGSTDDMLQAPQLAARRGSGAMWAPPEGQRVPALEARIACATSSFAGNASQVLAIAHAHRKFDGHRRSARSFDPNRTGRIGIRRQGKRVPPRPAGPAPSRHAT